ncbi:hypothetical protein KGQ20_38725, partial [Catenulispora sp. NF23]|nr:hypothetical protein [Catenulispora pinistramenti]
MPADKNDPRHAQGGSPPGRARGGGSSRYDQVSELRDAIAFLNRESVALPEPGTPPWEGRQPADPPPSAGPGPKPPLAPVRELRPPPQGRPPSHALPPAPPPIVENALQFKGAPSAGRRQLPPPPPPA